MPNVDLTLVSLDDLMFELDRRFDHWIFSGAMLRSEGTGGARADGKILTVRKWRGNSATCAGLASQIQIPIFEQHMRDVDSGAQTYED